MVIRLAADRLLGEFIDNVRRVVTIPSTCRYLKQDTDTSVYNTKSIEWLEEMHNMQAIYESKNAALENALLDSLSPDEPWSMIERFTSLVRESSSEDERTAFNYLAERLSALGVPHKLHMPELFLSVPVRASLVVGGKSYRAKTPAFSISTPAGGVSGETVRIEGFAAGRSADFFDFTPITKVDVRGKIVVVDGFGGPPPVWYFENQGAIGAIFINPGVDITGEFAPPSGARLTWTPISGSPLYRWSRSIDPMVTSCWRKWKGPGRCHLAFAAERGLV